MSILDEGTVDSIWESNDRKLIRLYLYDHLEWDDGSYMDHINLLKDKVNKYFSFIKNGELFDLMPEASDKELEIVIVGKFRPNNYGEIFYSEAYCIAKKNGLKLTFVLASDLESRSDDKGQTNMKEDKG